MRGGSWAGSTTFRDGTHSQEQDGVQTVDVVDPATHDQRIGFRCAR